MVLLEMLTLGSRATAKLGGGSCCISDRYRLTLDQLRAMPSAIPSDGPLHSPVHAGSYSRILDHYIHQCMQAAIVSCPGQLRTLHPLF